MEQALNAMLQRPVFFELISFFECLIANIASERLLTCVVPCVRDQCALALEPFPASVTDDHIACFQRSDTSTLTSLHIFLLKLEHPPLPELRNGLPGFALRVLNSVIMGPFCVVFFAGHQL